VKQYANLSAVELEAFTAYREDVKTKAFPQPEHFYKMAAGEAEKLASIA
jgi:ketopantoate hydroxymethyltransferase